MALTDLQRLRLKIADRAKAVIDEALGEGTGSKTVYQCRLSPIVETTDRIYVDGVLQTRDVDYTIDESLGLVTFVAAPASGAEITADYQWVTFTDEELQDMLDQAGSLVLAAMEAIRCLLADSERFLKYTFGQESVDRSTARAALQDLLDDLRRAKGGPVGFVLADTPEREELMAPFVEQDEELTDVD